MNGFQMNGRVVDPQKQSIVVELLLMKKTQARLQQRCVSFIHASLVHCSLGFILLIASLVFFRPLAYYCSTCTCEI